MCTIDIQFFHVDIRVAPGFVNPICLLNYRSAANGIQGENNYVVTDLTSFNDAEESVLVFKYKIDIFSKELVSTLILYLGLNLSV